jgi:hypothetical protein
LIFFFDDILFIKENPVRFIWLIPFIGLCMAYFEIFYALQSSYALCFGNFIKEVGIEVVFIISVNCCLLWNGSPLKGLFTQHCWYFFGIIITMFYAFYIKTQVFSSSKFDEIHPFILFCLVVLPIYFGWR